MGGVGSGRRRGKVPRGRKQTTDQFPAIDLRSLKRTGVIADRVQERIGGGPRRLPWIRLSWTPCTFGGWRP
jgi:hypothetical protein